MNYRQLAKQHYENARSEINLNDNIHLKYAALELRMAIEALTYDRAIAYKDEFPASEYETWQPRKVMAVLLELDPYADMESTISFGEEVGEDRAVSQMQTLGKESIFGMKHLKKHYDALGSYLHLLSMKKYCEGEVLDFNKFRKRCEDIASHLDKVLSSPVFNITFGDFSATTCSECGTEIRKRLLRDAPKIDVECHECDASYELSDLGNGRTKWRPLQQVIQCCNSECSETIVVWNREIRLGKYWDCKNCGGTNNFTIGIQHVPKA